MSTTNLTYVSPADLAGCGLKPNTEDGACQLEFDAAAVAGPGLIPVDDCKLAVDLVAGCGIEITDGTEISVKADDLAQSGLKTEGDCGLAVDPGCGIWIDGGKVAVAHDELAGDGLAIGDNCALDVDCGWIKTQCVKPGCGLWWNGDLLEVAHDELAGDGLVIGNNCALDVDCNWIKTECVQPGCGLWWNGDQLEVAHDELAGNGLTVGSNCQLDVDCDWIKANCVNCQAIQDCIVPGCSLWWNGGQLAVAHDELAGNGLTPGSGCQLDVDCDWIKANCLTCDDIRSCITPGCGLWWNGGQLAVAHDELAGNGLTAGSSCQLDVDCGWIKANCLTCDDIRSCITPGCGLWWNGGALAVAHDELAGNGLTPGSGCQLDVDCDYIKNNCLDCDTIRNCITPGCGLWWNGSELAVAHDELAGNGLTVGNQCQLDIDTSPSGGYAFSAVTNVDLSQSGCTLTLTRTVTAFELKTNSAGVVVGFDQLSSQTLTSNANLCDCDCLSNSIPNQPQSLLAIPETDWTEMLAQGGEIAWLTA